MNPSNEYDIYVPVYNTIPEKWEDARAFLSEHLREISEGINAREYGYYSDTEVLSGNVWFPDNGTLFRSVFRKVIDTGALKNFGTTGTKNIPHVITFSDATRITRLYGAATNPGASSITHGITLPFVDGANVNRRIGLEIDATNIIIRGRGDYSAYSCSYVVVEWIDEE